MNTTLPGKDAPAELTIKQISSILRSIDVELKEPKWLNPAPDCWSVHLQAVRSSNLYTNGKGASREACLASGLGEFIERLATNFFFADYFLEEIDNEHFCHYPNEIWFQPAMDKDIFSANEHGVSLLSPELRKFYDPENDLSCEDLLDNNSNSHHKGICALPFHQLGEDKQIFFPVSILNNIYVSNGMAAGNSREEATAQALSEIIERYVKKIIIQKGVALPDIPPEYLEQYPKFPAILSALLQQGLHVRIKDASLGGRYPVICVLLTDLATGGVYASFGASLRFGTAIERTLTELLQGRSLDQFGEFMPPSPHFSLVADQTNLESHFINSDGLLSLRMFRDTPDYEFTPWDFKGSTAEEVKQLRRIITGKGFTIYRAEYLHYPLYTCRIIVPGMSEIYSVDELQFNNSNAGSALRDQLLKLGELSSKDLLLLLEKIDSIAITEQQLVPGMIGVIFSENSAWHSLRIGELKAMIFLALGHLEDAAYWCEWCTNYGLLPEQRTRLYRLLHNLVSLEIKGERCEDYFENLRIIYSEEELQKVRKILSRQENFPDLERGNSWCEITPEHNNLMQVYRNQQRFKTNFLK